MFLFDNKKYNIIKEDAVILGIKYEYNKEKV